jgi:AraC-like DNA-binding protein
MVWIAFLPKLVYAPGDSEVDFEYLKPFYENHNNFLITAENVDESIPYSFSAMYGLFEDKPPHYKVLLKTHLYGILSRLLLYYDNYEKSSEIEYGKKLNEAGRIKQVFDLISKNYCSKITLDDAAETVNMSTHYFCKFFKKVTGYTFLEYLLRTRIDKAKELILSDKKSISEIAYCVGFENLSYFYRVFKRLTHMNPGDYYIGQHVS